MRILKAAGKALQIAIAVLLALLLACNVYLITMEHLVGKQDPTIFGYSVAVIASGSMEPALSVDDMILNHAQNSYAEGDIVTFRNGASLTTHRIVEVMENGFVTQGDANNAPDLDPVSQEQIKGRVVLHIPFVGRVIGFFRTPLGMISLIFAGFLLIELPFFFQRRREQTGGEETNYENRT